METEVLYTLNNRDYNQHHQEVITCKLCNKNKTTMLGTKLCDGCWELEHRIKMDPQLAIKVLNDIMGYEILKVNKP